MRNLKWASAAGVELREEKADILLVLSNSQAGSDFRRGVSRSHWR